jgi:hypothetical protein
MKESPIKYIEIYFGQINCYLMNIENQLNYIYENENDIKKIVTNIISKFSNDHIKHRNDRVKAINELRDIFVKDIEQRNQYKILIDEKIELFQTNLTKVENKLNEIYRFGLTLIEMDLFYIKQFIDEVKLKLKNQENKKTINKGYTNQLTTNQKKVVDELVTSGHKDSHIYHLLKQNNIFTLTEIEFIDYLNKHHGKNLDIAKRITACKHLTFTTEIQQKFKELQDKHLPKSQ